MSASSLHPSFMTMIEIRQELESLGVKTDSFIEKIKFIDALLSTRHFSTKTKLPSVSSSHKAAVQELLASLKLPRRLLSLVMERYNTCHSMIWLLDNSSRMSAFFFICSVGDSINSIIELEMKVSFVGL